MPPDLDMTPDELVAAEMEYRRRSRKDFLTFAGGLLIPSASGPQVFDQCMAPFQHECFRALEPSLKAVRDWKMPPIRRFWIERTKKAGKDSDLAVCLLWLVAFSERPLLVQVCAANRGQASIIKRRSEDLLKLNPWLKEFVTVQQNRLHGPTRNQEVVIEATDVTGGAHGETPAVLVLNELVHVAKWKAMEDHMNNADGVPQGVVIVSTNAGIKGTKAELWRREAMESKGRWKVMAYRGRAPWVSDEDVAEAKRRDPVGSEFKRLWVGQWVLGTGGAVMEDKLEACFRHDGPMVSRVPGWEFAAGLDLGRSHDHAGLSVLGANMKEQRLRVAWVKGYAPSLKNDKGVMEVDSDEVERACLWAMKTYNLSWFGYDPAEGGGFMAQRLRKQGLPMREMTFGAKNLNIMARAFTGAVNDGKLECYDDPEGRLRRDFGKFQFKDRGILGYKLEAVSDEYGHADVGTALVIVLPKAIEMIGGLPGLLPDDELMMDMGEKPITKEEYKEMPDSMREIMEAYDDMDENAPRKQRRKREDWLTGIY